ncbi:MAG: hypothetical protein AB7F99_04185 [Vicinamibacterales bacterium]
MSDTIDPKRFAECFERAAHALQAAAPLATRLRRELGERAEDAVHLEAALDRAIRAVRDMRWSDDV